MDVKQIDKLLPQTQCGECDYAGCLPYAEALAAGTASIDRCPPGGRNTVEALGALLGIDPSPYFAKAEVNTRPFSVAVIREAECIGCTKCIKACPVDAIIGTAKQMHAVIPHECTGCGLCVDPCPVDCIEMVTLPEPAYNPDTARRRYRARQTRRLKEEHQHLQLYRQKRQISAPEQGQHNEARAKQAYIKAALERVKSKKKE